MKRAYGSRIALLACLLVTFALVGAVLATGGAARLRGVLGSGAATATTGDVTLRGTLGQPVVGQSTGSGDVALGHGFWAGGDGSAPGATVYLPLVLRSY